MLSAMIDKITGGGRTSIFHVEPVEPRVLMSATYVREELSFPGASYTIVRAISPDAGRIVGRAATSGTAGITHTPFTWTSDEGFQPIPVRDAARMSPKLITDDGVVAGTITIDSGRQRPFVYRPGKPLRVLKTNRLNGYDPALFLEDGRVLLRNGSGDVMVFGHGKLRRLDKRRDPVGRAELRIIARAEGPMINKHGLSVRAEGALINERSSFVRPGPRVPLKIHVQQLDVRGRVVSGRTFRLLESVLRYAIRVEVRFQGINDDGIAVGTIERTRIGVNVTGYVTVAQPFVVDLTAEHPVLRDLRAQAGLPPDQYLPLTGIDDAGTILSRDGALLRRIAPLDPTEPVGPDDFALDFVASRTAASAARPASTAGLEAAYTAEGLTVPP